jgi:hypothetical protein
MNVEDEEDIALEQELALDLWQGQFEFVGEDYGGDGGVCIYGGGGGPVHITPPPRLGSNGIKKTDAHAWCEDLTEQVSRVIHVAEIRYNLIKKYMIF